MEKTNINPTNVAENETTQNDSDNDSKKTSKTSTPIPASGYLDDFCKRILNNEQAPAISTGFDDLDNILGGGLFAGLYFVGAISSLGKTTFVCQIADQIAASGGDCLIFSLEMSHEELIAKSISRISGIAVKSQIKAFTGLSALTTREVLNGIDISKRTEMLISAFEAYKSVAEHIYIYEGMGDMSVETIRTEVDNFITMTGRTPIVIIDYIQILAPYSAQYSTDKQNMDKTVLELKRLSRDKGIPVIGISSLNRQNYKDAVNMSAFKESGGIEYGADVLIGLQLRGMGQKDFDIDQAKKDNPRNVELKILKNRNGPVSEVSYFFYYPQFNLFEEYKNSLPFSGDKTGAADTKKEHKEVLYELVESYFSVSQADKENQSPNLESGESSKSETSPEMYRLLEDIESTEDTEYFSDECLEPGWEASLDAVDNDK